MSETITTKEEKQERKRQRRNHRRQTLQRLAQQEDLFLDKCITTAEDERTDMAKRNKHDKKMRAIETAHKPTTSSNTYNEHAMQHTQPQHNSSVRWESYSHKNECHFDYAQSLNTGARNSLMRQMACSPRTTPVQTDTT